MYVHQFVEGFCTVCGESLDYLVDNVLRDQTMIGPLLPVDEMQQTLPLSLDIVVP